MYARVMMPCTPLTHPAQRCYTYVPGVGMVMHQPACFIPPTMMQPNLVNVPPVFYRGVMPGFPFAPAYYPTFPQPPQQGEQNSTLAPSSRLPTVSAEVDIVEAPVPPKPTPPQEAEPSPVPVREVNSDLEKSGKRRQKRPGLLLFCIPPLEEMKQKRAENDRKSSGKREKKEKRSRRPGQLLFCIPPVQKDQQKTEGKDKLVMESQDEQVKPSAPVTPSTPSLTSPGPQSPPETKWSDVVKAPAPPKPTPPQEAEPSAVPVREVDSDLEKSGKTTSRRQKPPGQLLFSIPPIKEVKQERAEKDRMSPGKDKKKEKRSGRPRQLLFCIPPVEKYQQKTEGEDKLVMESQDEQVKPSAPVEPSTPSPASPGPQSPPKWSDIIKASPPPQPTPPQEPEPSRVPVRDVESELEKEKQICSHLPLTNEEEKEEEEESKPDGKLMDLEDADSAYLQQPDPEAYLVPVPVPLAYRRNRIMTPVPLLKEEMKTTLVRMKVRLRRMTRVRAA